MSDNQSFDIQVAPSLNPSPPSGGGKVGGWWRRYQKSIWIGLVSAAALVAGLLTYLLFLRGNGQPAAVKPDVKVEIAAPQEIRSGSEITYEITVRNLSEVKLQQVNLETFYPSGFIFLDSTPDPGASPRQFPLPDLAPRAESKITIVGRLEGAVQEIKTVSAKVYYVPENFRATFSAQAQAATEILAPDLELSITAPPHLVTGQTITYTIDVRNVATRAFSELLVKITYPERFEPKDKTDFPIPSLDIGQRKQIIISGKILEDPGKEALFAATLFLKTSGGEFSQVSRASAFTQILPAPLVIKHSLVNAAESIVPGRELRYEVSYENTGDLGLTNVAISVFLDSNVFDLANLHADKGQLIVKAGKSAVVFIPAIPFDSEPGLVHPGQKGSFQFTVPVLGNLAVLKQKNPVAATHAEFYSREFPEAITADRLTHKIETQITIAAKVSKIGENLYRIEFEAQNGVNDLIDARVEAAVERTDSKFFPDSVSPAEEKDRIQFVPVAGTIRWDLGRVFAFSGSLHEPRRIAFNLESPTSDVILKDIQVSGTDEFTGKTVLSNKIEELTVRQ